MRGAGSILFLENDPTFLRIRQLFLEQAGYTVHPAFSFDEARAILDTAVIHLIISDIRATDDDDERDISGLQFLREIDRTIPKIVLTAYPSVGYVRETLRPSDGLTLATDFLSKQEGPEIFVAVVQRSFQEYVRVNVSLKISFADDIVCDTVVQAIVEQQRHRQLVAGLLLDDLDDLLRKLFDTASAIIVAPLTPVSQTLLLVHVSGPHEEPSHSVIVQVGERQLIERERTIAATIGSTADADFLIGTKHVETQRLAAIAYPVGHTSLLDSSDMFWRGAQIEWSSTATAIRHADVDRFERGIMTLVAYMTQRLGVHLAGQSHLIVLGPAQDRCH